MSTHSRARVFFLRLLALAAYLSTAGLLGLAAQPPREQEDPSAKTPKKIVVEDEEPKPGVKKKITVDDDPTPGKSAVEGYTGTPADVRLDELVHAAGAARIAGLQAAFKKFATPFDRLDEKGGAIDVKPIPLRKTEWGGHDAIAVTPLDSTGKPRETRPAKTADIRDVVYFEKLVQDEADRLRKQPPEGATAADVLDASEKLLRAALRFHDFSRTERVVDGVPRNLRRGKGWDEVRNPLVQKLRSVRLDLLKAYVSANDPPRVRELTARLLAEYAKDVEVNQAVAGVMTAEADRLLKTGVDADAIAAKRLLDELDAAAPQAGGEAARKLRAQLRDLASKSLTRAREKKAVGDERTARDELARAAALDPDLEGVRDLQRQLQVDYPVLYVGVRQYPQNMSPATARLDSEKQVVELLFEGLMEETPDESGAVQYRPGAALGMPVPFLGGRDFFLRAIDRDPQGRQYLLSHDVVGTLEMLRAPINKETTGAQTWAGYPLTWLSTEAPTPKDNVSIRIAFGLSHPDPRTALTFKILPYRWLTENGWTMTDSRFAERPFGAGPFKLHSNPRPDGRSTAREMVFVGNPLYGRWPDRKGLPSLREIRLVEAAKIDTMKAFQDGKLHILTDVPTAEIDRYTEPNSPLRGKVDVVASTNNRRVYVLAVNLRRNYMQSKKLRQGISLAIDREDVLRKVFRAGKIEIHKSMTGPFPPNSWAASRGAIAPPPLMNKDLAVDCFKRYLADQGARDTIELAYPGDDPNAERACDEIRKQVEGLMKGEARKLTINLIKVSMADLMVQVQDQHTYDLAYIPFDYPDDWYPYALGAALDPDAAGRGGRNWFGFLLRDTNPDAADLELGRSLNKIKAYRDFSGELAPQALAITKVFNDSLPFIPLWQLDRHMVISKRVRVIVDDNGEPANPRLLNQTTLFQGVARWRLE